MLRQQTYQGQQHMPVILPGHVSLQHVRVGLPMFERTILCDKSRSGDAATPQHNTPKTSAQAGETSMVSNTEACSIPVNPLPPRRTCWHLPCPPLGSPSRSEPDRLIRVRSHERETMSEGQGTPTVGVRVMPGTARLHSIARHCIAR